MKASLRLLLGLTLMIAALVSIRATRAQETASDDASQVRDSLKQRAEEANKGFEHLTKATAKEINDSALTARVNAALLGDANTKNYPIGVSSENGVVTLTGRVDNLDTTRHAGEIVENVRGVGKVNNQLVSSAAASTSRLLATTSTQHCRRARIKAKVASLLASIW